jgi:hypothetical protein
MPDIRQLLVDAAAPPTRPLAVGQLIERAHQRRTNRWRRWLAGLAAAVAVGVPAGSLLAPAPTSANGCTPRRPAVRATQRSQRHRRDLLPRIQRQFARAGATPICRRVGRRTGRTGLST